MYKGFGQRTIANVKRVDSVEKVAGMLRRASSTYSHYHRDWRSTHDYCHWLHDSRLILDAALQNLASSDYNGLRMPNMGCENGYWIEGNQRIGCQLVNRLASERDRIVIRRLAPELDWIYHCRHAMGLERASLDLPVEASGGTSRLGCAGYLMLDEPTDSVGLASLARNRKCLCIRLDRVAIPVGHTCKM